ncbi:MAG: circadian clock KaiB family protein [Nitrosospira sp.]
MKIPGPITPPGAFEETLGATDRQPYSLQLYIAGNTRRSVQAIDNTRRACDESLDGLYELDIIDIYQSPAQAKHAQIIAVPTLVRIFPLPVKRIVGDMLNAKRIIFAVDHAPGPIQKDPQ